VGNKNDLVTERKVSYLEGKALARWHGWGFLECSAKIGDGIERAFYSLVMLHRRQRDNLSKKP